MENDLVSTSYVPGFLGGSVVKNLPADAGDTGDAGLIPGWGRSSGGGNGNSLQYSCLENPRDRGAWWATVHWVSKSRSRACKHHTCARTKSSMLLASPFFLHVLFLPFWGIVIMKKFSNIHRSIEVSL